MDAHDLIKSEQIRFYQQEAIYKACVEFRKLLVEMIDEDCLPVDIAINITAPSEFDVEKFKQKLHTEEEDDRE